MFRSPFVAIFREVTDTFTTINVIIFWFYSQSEASVHEREIFKINIKEYSKNVT